MSPSMRRRREFPPLAVPLVMVLLLSFKFHPFPGSPGVDEFYYDAFGVVESSDFAAARAFFIHQGHMVVFHDCPDAMAFQALYPLASIGYISSLPNFLINEGHLILQAQLRLHPQEAARLLLLPFLTRQSSIVTSPGV